MSGKKNARRGGSRRRTTTRRAGYALAFFLLIVVIMYTLVFATGDRSARPKLGIDLQGGTRVTLVPQGENPTAEQLSQARQILENRVNGMGVSGAQVVTDGNTLVITVPGENVSEAQAVGQTSQLLFRTVAQPQDPDLDSLPDVLGEMANRWVEHRVITKEEAEASISQIIDTINSSSTEEDAEQVTAPEVTAEPLAEATNSIESAAQRQETTSMLREDRQSTDATIQMAAASLLQCTSDYVDPLAGTDDASLPLVTCDPSSGSEYILNPAPVLEGWDGEGEAPRLTGNEIDTDQPISGGYNSDTGEMEVSFSFKRGGGAETWSTLTTEYLNQQVAITLDSEVISAPRINEPTPVGSATRITGDFTLEEAQELANNLRYGALPLSFAGENGEQGGTTTTIPASLGASSLKAGLIAGLVGIVLIAAYVFFYYRLYGLISLFTLFCSGVVVYGSLVLLGRLLGYSLDLAGIAGLIIGMGATADSFVVMYERIKDEVRDGYTFRSATLRGWDRAKRTVVTGNMVTLIGSVVVYFLAIGEVRGFAFTLGMTTIFDLLVTFLITAPLMLLASRRPFWAKPAASGMGRVFEVAARNKKLKEQSAAHGDEQRASTAVTDASGTGTKES